MKPPAEVLAKTYLKNLYAAAFSVCRNVQDAEDDNPSAMKKQANF